MRRRLGLGPFLTDRWLPAIEPTVRPSTFTSYRIHVHRHLVPNLGSTSLSRLQPDAINAFYRSLLEGRPSRRALAPTTVRRIHATLHRALRDAVRWGLLSSNPAGAADPPRARSHGSAMKTWSATELNRFLRGVAGDPDEPLWILLACTGMRRGEALGLRWMDVDMARASAAIRQTVIVVGSDVLISTPKTKRGQRVIALDRTTVAALRTAHQNSHQRSDLITGGQRPRHPAEMSQRFRGLVRELGLPRIRLHDLRHTHASLALQAGVHPKIVSERLGHATIAITLDIYSHVGASLQQEAARAIEELVLRS